MLRRTKEIINFLINTISAFLALFHLCSSNAILVCFSAEKLAKFISLSQKLHLLSNFCTFAHFCSLSLSLSLSLSKLGSFQTNSCPEMRNFRTALGISFSSAGKFQRSLLACIFRRIYYPSHVIKPPFISIIMQE